MKIYLFRHAQKSVDFTGDPDLTPEGHAQALRLLDKVIKNELPRPTELWVSPKKRAQSTFKPLSQHFALPLKIHDSLLEQQADENLEQFRKRIEKLFEKASENTDSVVFMCTHYDFVIEAMAVVPCDTDLSAPEFAHWSPCQYVGWKKNADNIYEFLEFKRIPS